MIIKHRLANPAITAKHKLSTDFDSVGRELVAFQQARGALPPTVLPKPAPPMSPPPSSGAVAEAVAAVKKMASGAALLFEWQESGQAPVDSELSAKRASICVDCPKNDQGGFTKYFTASVSENIRKRFQKLHDMKLTTPSDAVLGVCSACLCPLKLKVHTPLDLIVKRMKPEVRADLAPQCWILANT